MDRCVIMLSLLGICVCVHMCARMQGMLSRQWLAVTHCEQLTELESAEERKLSSIR